MTDDAVTNGHAAELKRRVERRRTLLDEIAELQEEIKTFKAEDKADGYTEKAISQALKELRKGADYQVAQLELELEVHTYRRAVGLPVTLEAAQEAQAKEASELPDPEDEDPGPAAGSAKRSRRAQRSDLN